MKTKPIRHKETNTFKFRPFSELVNEIDVDVFHKVTHANELFSEKTETYFYQCLQKWNFLNLSENYSCFRKEVGGIITLPQLLNRKEFIIDTLLRYLKLKDRLCLQTIFELILSVAKDLQVDFYPYFPQFLAAIVDLLQTKDAEQLEHTFIFLAYLFKCQWRYMIKDVGTVFDLLVPLLAETYPVYVNNFAAESFAFVVRKVKNKSEFLKILLRALQERKNGIVGCGKLLFHVLSGVQGQFHSCCETMLDVYLDALQDQSINQQLLYNLLSTVFISIAKEIDPQRCDILWTVIYRKIDVLSERYLIVLLKLMQLLINYKGGQIVKDSEALSKKLVELLKKCKNDLLLEEIANTSIATLLASNIKLLQEISSFLILKLLSIESKELLLKIAEKLIMQSSFETLILPQLLKKTCFAILDDQLLHLLVKIIEIKSPPSLNGINFNEWRQFNLKINGIDNVVYLSQLIDSLKEGEIKEDALKALIIIPHLSFLRSQLSTKLNEIAACLHNRVLQKDEHLPKINFAFLLTLECIVRIIQPDDFHSLVNKLFTSDSDLYTALFLYKNDISLLNALNLSLSYLNNSNYADTYINKINFDKIHQTLTSNLGSSNSQIRLSTSYLFSLFSNVSGLHYLSSNEEESKGVLEMMYLGEREKVTVHKYRDRLLRVQALNYGGVAVTQLNSHYLDCPLHWLLGNLYVNFSLLWEPVCQVIASYATKECAGFWPLFLAKLVGEEDSLTVEQPVFECDTLRMLANKVFEVNDRVDHENYKLLLWKCMDKFVGYCELKNRDYVGLFIDFVNENFFKSNSEDAKSCSVKKHEQGLLIEEYKEDMDQEISFLDDTKGDMDEDFKKKIERKEEDRFEEKPEEEIKTEESSKIQLGKTNHEKLLLTILQVFGKFMNTRSLYREPEILKIYLDLLSSKNMDIQKAALNCLYTYKFKYLMPYRSHLDNIVDEKNLKNELVHFQIAIDEVTEPVVQVEHRQELMAILMRILHAKMSQKIGMRTGGKAGVLVRRKTILRFLAGIEEEEMMIFVHMAFKPFQNYLPILNVEAREQFKVDLRKMVQDILSSIHLDSVVPPKRLQSAVNLLAVMIEQFGGKMRERLLPHLLALVLCILAQVSGILRRPSEVHKGYLPSLRSVRNNCISVLGRFFAHFENYDWISTEIDAIFEVAIFPSIKKLPIEGIHSPTPLLKMFSNWSHNPRYYPLFVKLNGDKETSLVFIIRLLLGQKTQKSVQCLILEMIEKMLTLQDFEKEDPNQMEADNEEKPMSLMSVVTNKIDIIKDDSINYGSAILLPHVTEILAYIELKLKRQLKQGTSKTELVILSRISEFARDPQTCDTLLTLILPILQKKCGDSEETVLQLLTTVSNLVNRVDKPQVHLRPIQYFLGQISAPQPRKMLMQVLNAVSRDNEELKKNQVLLFELNAYDRRWIDQPDFQRRLDAFTLIDNLIDKGSMTLEFGVAIIFNCFFFLKTENDLAMRDRSGQCLKTISFYLAKKYKDSSMDRKYLIDDTILALVRQSIRGKHENLTLQSISLLGHMSMECPEIHPVLRDLHVLTNKQDPEVDFFENMQHLQLHRRARALLKFCNFAKTLTKAPHPRTLTQFILPLTSTYLCNEKFMNKNSLVDAAIGTVGVVCRLLPWNQYEIVLRYYLDKLKKCVEFQKQLTRIIVIILDSFHFDLSKHKEVAEESSNSEVIKSSEEIVDKQNKTSEQTIELEETTEINDDNLHEALNNEIVIDVPPEDVEESAKKDILIMEKQTLLSQYMAKRLVYRISKGLLPQLHNSIAMRTRHEGAHKVNKKRVSADQEEEELMRVPIALALVKLLQKMPGGMLDSNLRGIFTKICTFLKSRLYSIRRTTREILQKIMVTLGPDHLHHLLKEMNALLTRGFQVHVLVFTIHAVLVSLKPYLKPEHMKSNLSSILSVCKIDLFGPSAEEKEIAGIIKNVSEAKSTKSYDIYHILGEFIDEGSLISIMLPLKEALMRTHSHKTVRKITECLRQLGLGLADNKYIEMKQMLDFLFGIASESIPQLMPENKRKKEEVEQQKKLAAARLRTHCLEIAPKPKTRTGAKPIPKISEDANSHVLIEFSLRLFHILLKRDKLNDPELRPLLDSYLPILKDCLKSQHVKLSTLSLQCLGWILKIDLPMVHSLISEICNSILKILHSYAAAELSKGDNYDLVMAGFKTMSVIVRDVKHFVVTSEQLRTILLYAEQDLHDSEKQATAFGLLRAVTHRKLIVDEIHPLMKKVAELSIISELDNVRKQARAVFYSYLVDYPLGKQLDDHIRFYLVQLEYETQPGRLSALELIYNIITGFPLDVLLKHSSLIFVMVGARLVNDDDPICKRGCDKCISELLVRLNSNQRSKLFDLVTTSLKDNKLVHRRLAAELCSIFVEVEKDGFESRLDEVLILLTKQFYVTENFDNENQAGRFVKIEKKESEDIERLKDMHIFMVLQVLIKICKNCTPFFNNSKYQENINTFAEYSHSFLAHQHLWVRVAASQLLGLILSTFDIEKVKRLLDNPESCDSDDAFIYSDSVEKLRSLILDSVAQLQPEVESEELFDYTTKNLVCMSKFLKVIDAHKDASENTSPNNNDLHLLWLVKKLRKSVNHEITQAPKSTIVRFAVFKWMAGVIATRDIDCIKPILFHFMSPLSREMATTEESNAPLRQLAKEVATMIKKKISLEEYVQLLNQAQKKLDTRRAERKRGRLQQFITDPELAAKRKIAKQQKKKEAKKRKIECMKGKKKFRKKMKKDVDLELI